MNRLLRKYDIRIFIIAALVVLTVAAACFIYVDPAGHMTGRPDKVEHVAVEDATYDSVSLKWSASSAAKGYIVYRSENKHTGYEKLARVTDTTYRDEELTTGETYWYRVAAAGERRRSGKSKKISAKPKLQTPRLTARSTGDGVLVKISQVPGADGYEIYRDDEVIAKGDGLEYMDVDTNTSEKSKYAAKAYREVEDKVVNSQRSNARVAAKAMLNISLDNYEEIPELLAGDKTFAFKGDIRSNATITKVKVGVKKKDADEWVSKETKFVETGVNDKNYNISAANEKVAMESLPAGNYRFVVVAELRDGTVETLKEQEFSVRQPSGGELIAKTATDLAWPYGTDRSAYKYKGGKPTDAYRAALDQAYGSRSSWGKQTRAGASCDVFVGTAVRVSGVDPNYPRGLDGVVSHYKNNTDKWELVEDKSESNLKPGDLIFQLYKGGGGHICIYLGEGKVAEAHYVAYGGTYSVIGSYDGAVKSGSRCRQYYVYRAKD